MMCRPVCSLLHDTVVLVNFCHITDFLGQTLRFTHRYLRDVSSVFPQSPLWYSQESCSLSHHGLLMETYSIFISPVGLSGDQIILSAAGFSCTAQFCHAGPAPTLRLSDAAFLLNNYPITSVQPDADSSPESPEHKSSICRPTSAASSNMTPNRLYPHTRLYEINDLIHVDICCQ